MNVQPDAVAKPMNELVAVAGGGQRFPGDRVRLPPRHGGSDLRECTSLSAQHGIVSVGELGGASPRQMVRVRSAEYPPTMAPISITTGSPAAIGRSLGS